MRIKRIFTLSISTFLTPFALASCGVQNLSVLNIVEDEKTLNVGQTYNIKISQENLNDVIIFSSSNSDVASVDSNGVVTALKEGSSIIEAKCGSLKDTIRIIVNDEISISELTLKQLALIFICATLPSIIIQLYKIITLKHKY